MLDYLNIANIQLQNMPNIIGLGFYDNQIYMLNSQPSCNIFRNQVDSLCIGYFIKSNYRHNLNNLCYYNPYNLGRTEYTLMAWQGVPMNSIYKNNSRLVLQNFHMQKQMKDTCNIFHHCYQRSFSQHMIDNVLNLDIRHNMAGMLYMYQITRKNQNHKKYKLLGLSISHNQE